MITLTPCVWIWKRNIDFVALKYSHFDVALILLENSSKHSSPGQAFVSSDVLSDGSLEASSRVNFG